MTNLEKVTPGQRIRSLPAGDWNAFIDAARAHKSDELNQAAEGELAEFSPVLVQVKNTTSSPLARYSVVGIGSPIADPQSRSDQFRNEIAFTGVVPTTEHCGRFVILAEDIAPGFVGTAVIAGTSLVKIDVSVSNAEMVYASAGPGNTGSLVPQTIGSARILWRESGTGTKWAIVRLGDVPQAIVHFELLSDLVLGGNASAAILVWDGSNWSIGTTLITVRDWHTEPGMWQGYAGYRGLALKNACLDRYEIVWMETPARSIEFALTSPMVGGYALANVTNYYLQGKPPGSTVTVYDAQTNYSRASVGALGKARWNDRLRRYEVIECNQMAFALACKLTSDLCPTSEAGSISAHTVLTYPPYGQTPSPLPSIAENYYNLAGKAGDWCQVMWDEDIDAWVITQVAHHEIEVPLEYRYYNGYLQAKHRKIAVMYCEDESDWRNEIPLVECEFVDGVRFTGCEETTGGDGTGSSPGDSLPSTSGSSSSSTTNDCGAIEYRTSKGYLFNNPTPQTWKNVLTFQEQAVLVAAAGAGNCITFQEKTVCSPCVGPADTTSVCATVATTVDCQCTCNCGDSGGSYPASGDSGGGTSSSCSCSCICHASSSISFG